MITRGDCWGCSLCHTFESSSRREGGRLRKWPAAKCYSSLSQLAVMPFFFVCEATLPHDLLNLKGSLHRSAWSERVLM